MCKEQKRAFSINIAQKEPGFIHKDLKNEDNQFSQDLAEY